VKTTERRLEKLELETAPPGRIVVCWGPDDRDWPPEERAADIERAHQTAGTNGTVIVVEYTHDWRPPPLEDDEWTQNAQ